MHSDFYRATGGTGIREFHIGITTQELLQATGMAIDMKQRGVLGKPCPDYTDENVSMKVVRIIQGYVNVVNKMVWRKDQ